MKPALLRASALIYQAAVVSPNTTSTTEKKRLLASAAEALAQADRLSNGKMKADHLTLSAFYELREDFGRAATEMEEYFREAPANANKDEIRNRIKRLQEAAANQRKSAP